MTECAERANKIKEAGNTQWSELFNENEIKLTIVRHRLAGEEFLFEYCSFSYVNPFIC